MNREKWFFELLRFAFAARPEIPPSVWCENNIRFNEPDCNGPFSFHGREFFREIVDCFGMNEVTDIIACTATQIGKTCALFGGMAWTIANLPLRIFFVMPNTHGTGGARNVASKRWKPMCLATPALADLLSSNRHEFKGAQQTIGGSIVDWTGSNSPANLASNPCRMVIQDETDKYKRSGDREADPSKLADERCKRFSNPKRVKTSTPTLVSGLIWQELLKTDFRRRFLPCPHCGRFLAFAWSAQMTVLPRQDVGFVAWDKEARRKDGSWDLDRVERSARIECPHCGGHINDNDKIKMDAKGIWRPTQECTPGMRGYHLPSLYAATTQARFGQMAIRFLTAKRSIHGLQGFINSDLAEPYAAQDTMSRRTELIQEITAKDDWHRIMWVDCQARAPYFWYVIRAWNGANSEALEVGSADTWDEIRQRQLAHKVKDVGVFADSGYGARSEAEVYRTCAEYCEFEEGRDGKLIAIGWNPAKGFPVSKTWKNEDGVYVPYHLREIDPFEGTAEAGKVMINLFEAASDFYKDVLANLRARRGGAEWAVSEKMCRNIDMAEYWRHMDGEFKEEKMNKFNGMVVHKWVRRHRHWPNHLFDCEVGQVAAASFFGLFPLDNERNEK